jgi:peptidoglycan/xylan/chitin deacetylase (PgdA/CDA1 family)
VNVERRALRDAAQRATDDVTSFRRDPRSLATSELGRFNDSGLRNLALRRLFTRVPLAARLLGWLAGRGGDGMSAKVTLLAAEGVYWRTVRSLLSPGEWSGLTQGPVILMYHAIGGARETASRYIIPRERFERQIAWLRARRYRFATLRQVAEERAGGLSPARTVVVTFDDGYRDNAAPLLAQRVPATIFVVTECAGGSNEWDAEGPLRERALLGWDELRALSAAGIEVGGHSSTHPILTSLSPERLEEEIRSSLLNLRRELGPGHYTFAYPHGRFNAQTKQAVEAARGGDNARYTAAACSRGGVNDPAVPQYELRRVEIKGTDSFLSFILMVELGRRTTASQLLRSLLFGE